MRILIAEDDSTSRTVLAGILKKSGHTVVETADGEEAWQELQQPGAPEMAILDWMMPRLDGAELVRLVRRQPTKRPPYLIMLTTKHNKSDIVAGLEAGANDYLPKPFDPRELLARVNVGRRMLDLTASLLSANDELQNALDHIKTLQGILPICATCKMIRDEHGGWNQLEVYIRDHTGADFSHTICPDCLAKMPPEFAPAPASPE